MTHGELLANHIRAGEVQTRRKADAHDPCPGCKRYIEVLLEAANHIESLADDDNHIAQLERAGYFREGRCKPRRWGRLYIRTECSKIGRDYAGPSQFIEGLAMAAANDEAFRKRQSAPYAFEDLGIHFIEQLEHQ
jgi:hypothetical protein